MSFKRLQWCFTHKNKTKKHHYNPFKLTDFMCNELKSMKINSTWNKSFTGMIIIFQKCEWRIFSSFMFLRWQEMMQERIVGFVDWHKHRKCHWALVCHFSIRSCHKLRIYHEMVDLQDSSSLFNVDKRLKLLYKIVKEFPNKRSLQASIKQ